MGSIGFLKKFFSRVNINLHETNKQPKRVFTPRPHRIQLLSLHHVQFICKNPLIEDPIPLLNISTNGAGLMKNAISTLPAPGTLLQGDFDFNGEVISIDYAGYNMLPEAEYSNEFAKAKVPS